MSSANPDALRAWRFTAAATASGDATICTCCRARVIAVYSSCLVSKGDSASGSTIDTPSYWLAGKSPGVVGLGA